MIKEELIIEQNEKNTTSLENYFKPFRTGIVGRDFHFDTVYGSQKMLYADWIASGRLYQPIEDKICNGIGPIMANTHSFSSESGKETTYHYHEARNIIKQHVNASGDDILITTGTGMTGALNKLLRILDLKAKNDSSLYDSINDKPVIFLSHMEHHSNQACWFELDADIVILPPNEELLIHPEHLENQLNKYKDRSIKIGSFTACSNVTGIKSPYHELAKIMHKHAGVCFVDFAASAPYVSMDMHPENPEEKLDAIFFSPHKFLGGPGSCGILLYDKKLHKKTTPDQPGGGNVKWTTPSGKQQYHDDLEVREDSGTPGILQVMRAALVIKLKESMDPDKMHARELELLKLFTNQFKSNSSLHILGSQNENRIGCISFNIEGMHYNLVVRLLNDRYGIQVRGGWSCASTYAHYLLDIDTETSMGIMNDIEAKNLTDKPGWVRVSLHPTLTNAELLFITNAITAIIDNQKEWAQDYKYNKQSNEFDLVNTSGNTTHSKADFFSF
ncbi:aminotransferase class V-fold PLP-dependent enzyme [Nonlabens antarcticus]|uniref:aminotransferase class V-fold PLP-dependent enzyme n=1 Tax=Nonlabens antarcticus TaxID=392714 RepID=UPI00189137B9|nr:aminotransferase class V-fold PLP-dependent enzyme [Nonlabens antarcticus]